MHGSGTGEPSRVEAPQTIATGDVSGSGTGELSRVEAPQATATGDVADGVIPAVNRLEPRRKTGARLRCIVNKIHRTLSYNFIDVVMSSVRHYFSGRFVSGGEPGLSGRGSKSSPFSHQREFGPRTSSRQDTGTVGAGRSHNNINALVSSTETEGLTNSKIHRGTISTTGLLSQTQVSSINSVFIQHRTTLSSSNENGIVRGSSDTDRISSSYEGSGGGSLVSNITHLGVRSSQHVRTIRRHPPTREPMHFEMNLESSRISSFQSRPISHLFHAFGVKEYAMAGFFYNVTSDSCVCFHCGVEWRNWRIGGDPVVEHARRSGSCRFLRQQCSWEFIASVQTLDAGGQRISLDDVLNHMEHRRGQRIQDVVRTVEPFARAEAVTPMLISREEMSERGVKLRTGVDNINATTEATSTDVEIVHATPRCANVGAAAPDVAMAETYSDATVSASSRGVGIGDNSVDFDPEFIVSVTNADARVLAAANETGPVADQRVLE